MNHQNNQALLKVQRYNPETGDNPYFQDYSIPVPEEKMNRLQAIEYIHAELDSTLAFRRYSCGFQYCNSCMMLINGKPGHACTHIVEPGSETTVAPLKKRSVLRDLIVDAD
jgi:succinate dehydrogenase / fumarate reductase iron-sulfur subunit